MSLQLGLRVDGTLSHGLVDRQQAICQLLCVVALRPDLGLITVAARLLAGAIHGLVLRAYVERIDRIRRGPGVFVF